MHHVYTRRIVVALVLFFALAALLFGPLVNALRTAPEAAVTSPAGGIVTVNEATGETSVTLPDGYVAFERLCASCHNAEKFADKVRTSLDPDAASLAQLEKLIGPPAHGGASPAEALSMVILIRTLAGLPSTYPPGIATPPAEATAPARPTATLVPTPLPLTDYRGVWSQQCATCHRAELFASRLAEQDDPDLRTRQAVEFLAGPPLHYNRPVITYLPAMNHVRELAGLEPLP